MSLVNEGNGMYMPVVPASYGGGYGNGLGCNDDFLYIILFLFALMGNGFGNGFGNGGGMMPWLMSSNTSNDAQRGFDQQAVMNGIGGIEASINALAQGQCNGFAGTNAAITNGISNITNNMTAGQMANMQQLFNLQSGLTNQLNTIGMNQQNCCCENRAGIADLKYTVANEACADRAVVNNGLRDLTAQGVANTTAILNTINGGIQSIKDQLCNDKIDSKNEIIANLRQELAMKDLKASQTDQNAFIQQGFANEVDQLYNRLNNCPVPSTPVYGRTPIFAGQPNYGGCPCAA